MTKRSKELFFFLEFFFVFVFLCLFFWKVKLSSERGWLRHSLVLRQVRGRGETTIGPISYRMSWVCRLIVRKL